MYLVCLPLRVDLESPDFQMVLVNPKEKEMYASILNQIYLLVILWHPDHLKCREGR